MEKGEIFFFFVFLVNYMYNCGNSVTECVELTGKFEIAVTGGIQ